MPDIVNELATRTGISSDLVQRGLGALLSFLKAELGDDVFHKIQSHLPGASGLVSNVEAPQGSSDGGLFGALSGLAGKIFGGKAEEGAKLLESLHKLGFDPAQIEAFLPKALEFIKAHLPPDLIEKVMASLPALAKLVTSGAKPEG
jgi:hypothetical protein